MCTCHVAYSLPAVLFCPGDHLQQIAAPVHHRLALDCIRGKQGSAKRSQKACT